MVDARFLFYLQDWQIQLVPQSTLHSQETPAPARNFGSAAPNAEVLWREELVSGRQLVAPFDEVEEVAWSQSALALTHAPSSAGMRCYSVDRCSKFKTLALQVLSARYQFWLCQCQ